MSDPLNYSKSRWNGWNGNECVYKKEYHKAIEYYNTAIELYPLEYRYFVNRSFCFDRLQRFESALEDAQRALCLQSDWGKCYYRKARALKGLNKLEEAEVCFLKVIELEGSDCEEAQHELRTLRQSLSSEAVNKSGHDLDVNESKNDIKLKDEENIEIKNSSEKLSSKTNIYQNAIEVKNDNKVIASETRNRRFSCSDFGGKNLLKELSDYLLNTNIVSSNQSTKDLQICQFVQKCAENESNCVVEDKSVKTVDKELRKKNNRRIERKGMDEIVEIWDDSRNHWSLSLNKRENICPSKCYRKSEPTNPWNFRGLFISNIRPSEETKQKLRNILSDFGKVTLIDFIPEDTAIVNFDNPESPRNAMSRLQGVHMPNICVHNQKLQIRFRPLNDSKNYPSINCVTERNLNYECYFWRTTGCTRSNSCKLKHITANKGVDLQPWYHLNA